jgi:hypothetical protein
MSAYVLIEITPVLTQKGLIASFMRLQLAVSTKAHADTPSERLRHMTF